VYYGRETKKKKIIIIKEKRAREKKDGRGWYVHCSGMGLSPFVVYPLGPGW